ncbi:hypothetical protein [Caldanaerobius fijiensis]|nr:hypothetical protein [Caldanaerobius fijiensis]
MDKEKAIPVIHTAFELGVNDVTAIEFIYFKTIFLSFYFFI